MESRIWNEIEKYLSEIFDDEEIVATISHPTLLQAATVQENAKDVNTIISEIQKPQPIINEDEDYIIQENSIPASNNRTKNIDEIKRKYIIGKISGKEIKDNSGNIIARQNELITEDIVDLADQNGKLVELIVHMTIQL